MTAIAQTPGTSAVVPEKKKRRSPDELMATASASRLNTWQQCRLKFYFRYVLALETPKSPALHVGSCVHAVLKFWNKARWHQTTPTLRELHDVYAEVWTEEAEKEPVKWDEDEAEQKLVGWKLLETYFRESPIQPDEKPRGVEVSVEADLSAHGLPNLVGIIDLVRPGGKIVDFKTTSKTPNPDSAVHQFETQISCYAVLYRESTGESESGFELHQLVKLKSPKLQITALDSMSAGQEARLHRVLASYLDGLDRRDFVPSPGLQCMSCEFYGHCRSWPKKEGG